MKNLFGYNPERGSASAELFILADSPSKKDLANGMPFSGDGAVFFVKELEAAGYHFKDCFASTAIDFYPPSGRAEAVFHTKTEAKKDHTIKLVNGAYVKDRVLANAKRVWQTIDRVKPKFILSLGSLALWMLTGENSADKHRGSMLTIERPWGTIRLLPTYHPNQVMRKQEWKRVWRNDLSRINLGESGWDMPNFDFLLYPSANNALATIANLLEQAETKPSPLHIAADIETRGGLISVLGFAWSKTQALVIPFTSVKKANYFTPEEEFQIIRAFERLVTHPNVEVSGQNYHYDDQYLAKLYGIPHHCTWDSMHMAHTLWTKNLKLSLDFLASMFCQWYRYWKDDGKEFHKSIDREEDELLYFKYNGYDCCYTWEIVEALKPAMQSSDFRAPFSFQKSMHKPLSRTMNRGVRFDKQAQVRMRQQLKSQINAYERWFQSLPIQDWFAGDKGSPWYNSSHKLKKLFYDIFALEKITKRTPQGYRPTCDQAALKVIGKREPVLKHLCDRLIEYSSLQQFNNLYLAALPDTDGRMHPNYGLAGTDTFRLASRGDVFGTGMNLQNISKG